MIKKWLQAIARQSVRRLTRLAAVLALIALALMVLSVLVPRPIIVVGAMSIGHGIGGLAFVCYLLAVVLDVSRAAPPPDSLAPRAGRTPNDRS